MRLKLQNLWVKALFHYVLLRLLFSDTGSLSGDNLLVGFDTMNEGRLISFRFNIDRLICMELGLDGMTTSRVKGSDLCIAWGIHARTSLFLWQCYRCAWVVQIRLNDLVLFVQRISL